MRSACPIFAPVFAKLSSYCISICCTNAFAFFQRRTASRVIRLIVRSWLATVLAPRSRNTERDAPHVLRCAVDERLLGVPSRCSRYTRTVVQMARLLVVAPKREFHGLSNHIVAGKTNADLPSHSYLVGILPEPQWRWQQRGQQRWHAKHSRMHVAAHRRRVAPLCRFAASSASRLAIQSPVDDLLVSIMSNAGRGACAPLARVLGGGGARETALASSSSFPPASSVSLPLVVPRAATSLSWNFAISTACLTGGRRIILAAFSVSFPSA